MKETPAYTEFHPRWYRPRISTYWWLGRWPYLRFILRELSSVFVALGVVLTLLQMRALWRGPQAYADLQHALRSPLYLALAAISLVFVMFHAITWFNLAPRAMVVRMRGRRVPDVFLAAPNYVAWAAVSALVAWLVLGG